MTSYVSHPDQIKALLTKCLEKAEKDIPTKVRSSVPINMEATAGMRVLKYVAFICNFSDKRFLKAKFN